MRPFLSRITPSGSVFRVILVPRDPWDNSEVTVRARSFVTTHLVETVFSHLMTQKTLANGRIHCRRRKSSPHTPKLDKNWPLWTKKCSWPWWGHFLLWGFWIWRFLHRRVMVKPENFQCFQTSPNDHTPVPRWLGRLGTLFTPTLIEIEWNWTKSWNV